jgi:hypothetical protein
MGVSTGAGRKRVAFSWATERSERTDDAGPAERNATDRPEGADPVIHVIP